MMNETILPQLDFFGLEDLFESSARYNHHRRASPGQSYALPLIAKEETLKKLLGKQAVYGQNGAMSTPELAISYSSGSADKDSAGDSLGSGPSTATVRFSYLDPTTPFEKDDLWGLAERINVDVSFTKVKCFYGMHRQLAAQGLSGNDGVVVRISQKNYDEKRMNEELRNLIPQEEDRKGFLGELCRRDLLLDKDVLGILYLILHDERRGNKILVPGKVYLGNSLNGTPPFMEYTLYGKVSAMSMEEGRSSAVSAMDLDALRRKGPRAWKADWLQKRLSKLMQHHEKDNPLPAFLSRLADKEQSHLVVLPHDYDFLAGHDILFGHFLYRQNDNRCVSIVPEIKSSTHAPNKRPARPDSLVSVLESGVIGRAKLSRILEHANAHYPAFTGLTKNLQRIVAEKYEPFQESMLEYNIIDADTPEGFSSGVPILNRIHRTTPPAHKRGRMLFFTAAALNESLLLNALVASYVTTGDVGNLLRDRLL